MTPFEEIEQLLAHRSFHSFAELYGAVRKLVGTEVHFDCFEEWRSGEVVIRKQPAGGEGGWSCDLMINLAIVQAEAA